MTPRVNPAAYLKSSLTTALIGLQRQVEASGLEHSTLELIKLARLKTGTCRRECRRQPHQRARRSGLP